MKTIIARFEDMKKDPMAILEDGVSANKVEAALATIGIALRNSEGEFRALQDVMDELGMKWSSLTRNQQAYIATVAAGSRQQSRFLALMNNYDRTLDLIIESQNSAGAAAEQYAIYQDSAAAATARLTAAWEEFYSKIVNSEQIIWVINSLEKLVEVMSKVGPVISAIGASLGALSLQTVIKGVIPKLTTNFAEAAIAGKTASVSITGLIKGGGALLLTFGKVIAIVGALTIAIYGAVKAVNWLRKELDKDKEIKQLSKDIKQLNEDISTLGDKTDSLEKLMKRYEELENKVYLTDEEQKELNDTIGQIASVSESAITYIDELGNAHIRNKEAIEQELEIEKERQKFLAQQQLSNLSNLDTQNAEALKTAGFGATAGLVEEYNNQTSRLQLIENASELIEGLKSYNANIGDLDALQYLPNKLIRIITEKLSEKYENLDLSKVFTKEDLENVLIDLDEDVTPYINEIGNIVEEYYDKIKSIAKSSEEFDRDFEKYFNQELTNQIYKNLTAMGGKEAVLGKALQEAGFTFILTTLDKLNSLLFGSEQKNFDKIDSILQQYENEELSADEVLDKLKSTIDTLDEAIEDHLDEVAKKAKQESKNDYNRREQFIRDNLDYLGGFGEALHVRQNIRTGSITESEQAKMQDLINSNQFDDKSATFGLFNIFAEDNEELDKKIDLYVKKLEAGLFDEADRIKKDIVALLSAAGMEGDLQEITEQLVNLYIQDIEGVAEKRLAQAKDNYSTAKSIYDKDSAEALTTKEYDFLKQQDSNIDRYININKEGEKYLSILGKVITLENARNEYAKSLSDRINVNNDSLEHYRGILNGTVELTSEEEENRENILNTARENINVLETENHLLEQELTTTADIVDKTMSISFKENLSQAEQTYDNINKIGKALGEAQQNAGQLTFATAQSLLALDDAYYQYVDIVDGIVTLDAEGAEKMRQHEKEKYDDWLESETAKLNGQIEIYKAENQLIEDYFNNSKGLTDEEKEIKLQALKTELEKKEEQLNNLNKGQVDADKQALSKNSQFLTYLEAQWSDYYTHLAKADKMFKEGLTSVNPIDTMSLNGYFAGIKDNSSILTAPVDVKVDKIEWEKSPEKVEKQLKEKLEANLKRIEILEGVKAKLEDLSPAFKDAFDKGISEAAKGGEKALKELNDVIDDTIKAIEDLDKLLVNIKNKLGDINVKYNPFTDLFEAWEHEWDYYYNIKRLIAEIGTQGQYIDNIISADYISADKKVNAYHAKIGNLLSSMAANDAYIESLRTGMTQTAVELMEDYGQYYKVDPNTGQVYQNDSALKEINDTINQRKEEIYQQQKLQNEKENDLALEEAKLDALEEEKSAYEDILNTLQSQIDSLSGKDDITADLSDIEAEKAKIKADIEVTEDSIKNAKQIIQQMEDDIQDVEVSININEKSLQESEKYVDKMEDKLSEYEQYWDTLNETIAGQQELLQQLTEIYNDYIDTAISTEQELYDAIVENYQDEIDKKKKQYDELKALDNSYLQSVKNSVNQERQIRQDAEKQKSYQQSLQRAQLLQLDTSGAYKAELAQLTKEMESQRQELYDDLVDKQVEALEKEIENRHELYDKEVAALEERLAYMQENAILLWETVNSIVAEGAENMMSILENTTSYINSSELSRQKQRNTWELNVKKTFDGIKNDTIDMLKGLIDAGNQYITEKLPEVGEAVDDYTLVFQDASNIMDNYNNSLQMTTENLFGGSGVFQNILNSFMSTWNTTTNALTGYTSDWSSLIANLKAATEANVQALEAMHNEGGSIKQLDESLRESAKAMYDDFLEERRRYRNELESLISSIRNNIESAVKAAADAIKNAANSIQGGSSGSNGSPSGSSSTSYGGTNNTGNSGSASTGSYASGQNEQKFEHWKAWFNYGDGSQPKQMSMGLGKEATITELYNNWLKFLENLRKNKPNATSWGLTYYKQGGLADFTGPAWLDGTKSTPEAVLNPKQTRLFTSMVNSLEKASNNSNINSPLGTSYNIGDINTTIKVDKLDSQTDINRLAMQVEDKIVRDIRNRVSVSITKGV